ncbi:MAG TPA: amidohydrolase family protein [Blastocatellia bacterium]|nr:amidohydrolase family protein [Blastocatellia bacterium]
MLAAQPNPRISQWRFNRAALIGILVSSLAFALPTASAFRPQAQGSPQPLEAGKFRLHKFQQAIGEESYEVTRDGDTLVTKCDFKFTDRGTPVPLQATLRTRQDLTPLAYEIKGKTSRLSEIDTAIELTGRTAKIREGRQTREAQAADHFFTISGYAPVAVQMMMVRYWATTGGKGALKTLPGGDVSIQYRGKDTIEAGGKRVELERYSVGGVVWGREALWFDSTRNLIATVCVDAESDHFEAIREGYESALPVFVKKAAEDGMAGLLTLATRFGLQRKAGFAFTGATLIDGTGSAPIADSVVLTEGDRIIAAGPRASVKIPPKATVIDMRGKTILPGLWDMHAHYEQVEWGPIYLAAGVTTVRDVGNEFEYIVAVRDAIYWGRGLGPRMLLAGIVDGDSPMALGVIRANTPEQAREVVSRYKNARFSQIKIYSSVKLDVLKAICDEAHRQGLTVTGHIPNGLNAVQAVEAGMDQINHIQYLPPVLRAKDQKPGTPINFESPEAQRTLQFFKDHHTVVDPTMALMELILHPSNVPVSTFEPGITKVAPELAGPLNNTGQPPEAAEQSKARYEMWLATISALHRAGIPIIAGTDQAVPGHSLHREIELYVKAGFTPMEAIQAATIVPARLMKLDNQVGTVEAGKRADLIFIEGDPLKSISNIRNVRWVVAAGRLYNPADLWQSVGFKP